MSCEDRQRGLGHGPHGQGAFGELLKPEKSQGRPSGMWLGHTPVIARALLEGVASTCCRDRITFSNKSFVGSPKRKQTWGCFAQSRARFVPRIRLLSCCLSPSPVALAWYAHRWGGF